MKKDELIYSRTIGKMSLIIIPSLRPGYHVAVTELEYEGEFGKRTEYVSVEKTKELIEFFETRDHDNIHQPGFQLLHPESKQAYLIENSPIKNPPKLDEQRECLHCNQVITVGDFKAVREENSILGKPFDWICCPNFPQCDGTIVDWIPMEPQITR